VKIKRQTVFNLLLLALVLAVTGTAAGAWPVTLAGAGLALFAWKMPKRGGRR
jgi:hypothetical protein